MCFFNHWYDRFYKGFRVLERVEKYTVSLNLAMIAGLIVSLLIYNGELYSTGSWHLQNLAHEFDVEGLKIVLGLLIVVQGFEPRGIWVKNIQQNRYTNNEIRSDFIFRYLHYFSAMYDRFIAKYRI